MAMTQQSWEYTIKTLKGASEHSDFQNNPQGDSVDVLAFDVEGHEGGILSNYAIVPMEMPTPPFGSRVFPTVEQYFQYSKDPGNEEYLNAILAGDAQNARELGQNKRWLNEQGKEDFSLADAAMQRALHEKAKNPQVRKALRDTGNSCLIEDTGRRSPANQDGNWGWKKGGTSETWANGGNKLGIMLMKERNKIHREENNNGMVIDDPHYLSERARGIMKETYPQADLISVSKKLPNSTLPQRRQPSPQPTSLLSPVNCVYEALQGRSCTGVAVLPNPQNRSKKLLHLTFAIQDEANKFKKIIGFDTPTLDDGRGGPITLVLDEDRANKVFNHPEFGLQYYVSDKPAIPMTNAVMGIPYKAPIKSSNPVSSQGRVTPLEYVKRKLDSLSTGCSAVKVGLDKNNPSKKVIKLVFNTTREAEAFKKTRCGTNTPTSDDGKTLTLVEERATRLFTNLRIPQYGREKPRPTFQALADSFNRPKKTNLSSFNPPPVHKVPKQPLSNPTGSNKKPLKQLPLEQLKTKLTSLNCVQMDLCPSIKDKSRNVLKLRFITADDANNFRMNYSDYVGGRGLTPRTEDGKVLFLDDARAPLTFMQLGINTNDIPSLIKGISLDSIRPNLTKQVAGYYENASYSAKTNRWHALEAEAPASFKDKYQNMRGDFLKTKILSNFKSELEGLAQGRTQEEFLKEVDKIRTSNAEYKTLATGQGITTRLFGLKTTSVDAFDKMVEDIKNQLPQSHFSPLSNN